MLKSTLTNEERNQDNNNCYCDNNVQIVQDTAIKTEPTPERGNLSKFSLKVTQNLGRLNKLYNKEP